MSESMQGLITGAAITLVSVVVGWLLWRWTSR